MTAMISDVLSASWVLMTEMAPYLLLGFAMAGVLSVVISPAWVERHLGRGGFGQIAKASLFGVPLPLCSSGVIPVAASLRRHGAGKGATTAFLLSTPQTGVDSIAVTWALLGPFLAVFRPLAALATGLFGGGLVQALDREAPSPAEGPDGSGFPAASCGSASCGPESSIDKAAVVRILEYGFVTLPRDIGRPLIVGILISGVIAAVVEPAALSGILGRGVLPILAAMLIGVPLYVCATASVPIALAMIHAGLSPGAALAFLIAGPATNAATLTTLWRILGRGSVVLFLMTVAGAAIGSGLLVDGVVASGLVPSSAIVEPGQLAAHTHDHAAAGGFDWFGQVSAVSLLLVLGHALWPRRRHADADGETAHEREGFAVELKVSGMRCNGCVQSLSRVLGEIDGVETVEVQLDGGIARVRGSDVSVTDLLQAVTSLGFRVEDPEILEHSA